MTRIHSAHCITPPYMLREILNNGTPAQRDMAMLTLTTSEQMRGQRKIIREVLGLMANLSANHKERIVYSAQYGVTLPGKTVRNEGDGPTGDVAVDEAYNGSGITYDLFFDVYNRNSINNNGMRIDSSVHYQKGYDNAFWNGSQMVYGDGDEDLPESERLFNRFTAAVDVIGHELTHGVTQFEAALAYQDQSGALNESMSDVFGSLVKQYQHVETADQANWVIGEGLFAANINGAGIRSMKAPGTAYDDPVLGKDPQPGHMDNFVQTTNDNGGVHINSGIPNRAFYVTAVEIGGHAWEKAGQIWYTTLKDKLSGRATFQEAADLTFEAAGELYGKDSLEQKAVRTGWAEVGIPITGESSTGCFNAMLRMAGLAK